MVGVGGMLTSAVVKIAGDKLGSALGEQANLAWNFNKDLEDMKDTMESVAVLLQDAEKQSGKNKSVQLWLKRLKHAAVDISDMMDDYQDTDAQATAKMPGIFSCLTAARKRMVLANKMKSMREKLRKINEQGQKFNFTLSTDAHLDQHRYDEHETTSVVNEAEILGRDGAKKEITDLLSASHSKDQAMFLPIYGLGGVGKSTLAKLVYNDTQFKKYDHRVWVYVSQEFDLMKIGRSIISQLPTEGGQKNIDTLELIYQCINDLFPDKKILIVLDDIWEEDGFQLEKLKSMIEKNGSMVDVLVTTRNERIANKICTNESYKLEPLKDGVCWDIIKRVSGFEGKSNKEKLEEIGLDIAKKCGGVALAARALGYILKYENLNGWSNMNRSDIWNVSCGVDNSEHMKVLPSLKLSYEHMHSILKLCFSYCAIFPKGHDIHEVDLIHQWFALGFIKEPSEGKKYITRLLGMSFLQHSKLPVSFFIYAITTFPPSYIHACIRALYSRARAHLEPEQGPNRQPPPLTDAESVNLPFDEHNPVSTKSSNKHVARYNMHDLVHDLARSVIGDELIVIDATDAAKKSNSSEQTYCRYVLLTNYDGQTKLSNILPKKVRALHLSGCSNLGLHDGLFSSTKCLRILDFRGCSSAELPVSIGKLKQLKCLIAPRTQNEKLPESIVELSKLQYLNLHGSSLISELPKSIGNLSSLIHLDMSDCSDLSVLPESFGGLKAIVHLDMSGCTMIRELPGSFGNLTNLQQLHLSGCSSISVLHGSFGDLRRMVHLDMSGCSMLRELPASLGNLTNLQHLDLSYCSKLRAIPASFGSLVALQYLDMSLCREIHKLPESFKNLRSLLHLNMTNCLNVSKKKLSRILCGLTALQYLNMSWYVLWYDGTLHHDAMRNLTNVEHLDISHSDLKCLPESIGNLKKLHTLNISHCPALKSLPDCVSEIATLKSLLIEGCSDELGDQVSSRLPCSLTLPLFKVRVDDGSACSNLPDLECVNVGDLRICSLENVRFLEEACKIKLSDKTNLSSLALAWSLDADRSLDDKDLLGQLEPPRGLKHLILQCYNSPSVPSWLMGISDHLPNLVGIELKGLTTCSNLPPLGQLPNLERLFLDECPSITKIDKSFCGGKGAFRRLTRFRMCKMEGLEEWRTTYSVEDGEVEEFMFPVLDELDISTCQQLRLKPCPPTFRSCEIVYSDQVISSLEAAGGSHLTSSAPTTEMNISGSDSHGLELFHHFPALHTLKIQFCAGDPFTLPVIPTARQPLSSSMPCSAAKSSLPASVLHARLLCPVENPPSLSPHRSVRPLHR
ncbi:hypothetical protein EJB05_13684, partial [Eragrostis curvula]